jgi:hypothetical protein
VFGVILIDSCFFGFEKWGRRKVIKKLNQFSFNKDKKAKRKKEKNAKCQKEIKQHKFDGSGAKICS